MYRIKKNYFQFRGHVLRTLRPVNLRPRTYYMNNIPNVGDFLGPWLLNRILGYPVDFINPLEERGVNLFTVGSILSFANRDTAVWGSGFIAENARLDCMPNRIYSVRGPLTAQRLSHFGVQHPEIYGDPGLLVGKYLPQHDRRNRINPIASEIAGIIPHVNERRVLDFNRLPPNLKFMDVATTSVEDFVAALADCDHVFSSSLHGIIIAESLGLKAVWIELSGGIIGKYFKFIDYYRSTGRAIEKPVKITSIADFAEIDGLVKEWTHLHGEIRDDLCNGILQAFPQDFFDRR